MRKLARTEERGAFDMGGGNARKGAAWVLIPVKVVAEVAVAVVVAATVRVGCAWFGNVEEGCRIASAKDGVRRGAKERSSGDLKSAWRGVG